MPSKPPKQIIALVFAVFAFLSFASQASASDWRYGFSLGYGGAGLTEATTLNTSPTLVQRSEGPGVISIFVDRLMGDRKSFGFEHSRGFRLGPFSSGVSFTGFVNRWYFFDSAPSAPVPAEGTTTLLVKRYVPFLGVAYGIALADINRTQDQVANATGSGVYVGFKGGADYALAPGVGLRPEFIYNMTFASSPTEPTALNEFALQCALYFYL